MRLFPHAVSTGFTHQHWVQGCIYKSILSSQVHKLCASGSPSGPCYIPTQGNAAEVRTGRAQLRQRHRLGMLSAKLVFKTSWCWGSCGLSFSCLCTRTSGSTRDPFSCLARHIACDTRAVQGRHRNHSVTVCTSPIRHAWGHLPLGWCRIRSNKVIPVGKIAEADVFCMKNKTAQT